MKVLGPQYMGNGERENIYYTQSLRFIFGKSHGVVLFFQLRAGVSRNWLAINDQLQKLSNNGAISTWELVWSYGSYMWPCCVHLFINLASTKRYKTKISITPGNNQKIQETINFPVESESSESSTAGYCCLTYHLPFWRTAHGRMHGELRDNWRSPCGDPGGWVTLPWQPRWLRWFTELLGWKINPHAVCKQYYMWILEELPFIG